MMQQLGINMPAAVIMEENYDKLLEQCEAQELEVSPESPCVLQTIHAVSRSLGGSVLVIPAVSVSS